MSSTKEDPFSNLRRKLGTRSIVLVGMMGAGKTTIGRRLAKRIGLGFTDADAEIETAAGMRVQDIFEVFGEKAFRDGEQKVIERLMAGEAQVLATGGGAFLNESTRNAIKRGGISVWLKAEIDVLMERVKRKKSRPLLLSADPEATMRRLLDERAPIYALADIVIESNDNTHEKVVAAIVKHLGDYLKASS